MIYLNINNSTKINKINNDNNINQYSRAFVQKHIICLNHIPLHNKSTNDNNNKIIQKYNNNSNENIIINATKTNTEI